jgi:glycosyltransferase involved in cell wall biosynthesis
LGTINAVGEERYYEKLKPLFDKYKDKIKLLGTVEPEVMPYFFKNIDVLVVSSINSTEAFGMVQIEAMFEGTPVVATDFPGVRIPIQITGMGKIAKIADSKDLAEKIISVLDNKPAKNEKVLNSKFDTKKLTQDYLDLYESAIQN